MIEALQSAVGGLRTAAAQVDRAAATIVRAQTPAGISQGGQETSPRKERVKTGIAGGPVQRIPVVDGDLMTGIIDLQKAAQAYKTSAKMVATTSEMQAVLLDALT